MKGMTRDLAMWLGKWNAGDFQSNDGSRKGLDRSDVDAMRDVFAANGYGDGSLYHKPVYRGLSLNRLDTGKVLSLLRRRSSLHMKETVAESWSKDPRTASAYMYRLGSGVLLKRRLRPGSVVADLSNRKFVGDVADWWEKHGTSDYDEWLVRNLEIKNLSEVVALQQCRRCGIDDIHAMVCDVDKEGPGTLEAWSRELSSSGYDPEIEGSDPEAGDRMVLVLSGRKAHLRFAGGSGFFAYLRKFGLD